MIERFWQECEPLPLSYAPVGAADQTLEEFTVDELVVTIGRGENDFNRAKQGLASWKHFDLGWLTAWPSKTSLDPGTIVAVVIRHLGFWSMNGCRVVYGIGNDKGATKFGFAYGTLVNHAEAGEELFEVAFDPASERVTYRIRAASRPRAPLAWLGYPVVRALQRRFRLQSAEAMKQVIRVKP